MGALAAQVLALLPQTQCRRCGYPDCAGYAQAMALGEADINQCPPGGAEGIDRLAGVTGRAVQPLNPANGAAGARSVAFIDENWCIGCTLCIEACPTDAIMGSNKLMHTVLEAYCTGCELCLAVCPVDCIELENVTGSASGWAAWSQALAEQASQRYQIASERRSRQRLSGATQVVANDSAPQGDAALLDKKRSTIAAVLKRARLKRESGPG